MKLYRNQTIVTPEHVQLQYQTAGIGTRGLAQMIDVTLLILVLLLSAFMYSALDVFILDKIPLIGEYVAAFMWIYFFVLIFGYFLFTEYFMGGQSIGKKLVGIKVIQDNGQSLTFLSSVIRNFVRLIDLLPSGYLFGITSMFFHNKDKRIGDMAAGTIVVIEKKKSRISKQKRVQASLQSYPQELIPNITLSEWKKQQITRDDWRLVESFVEKLHLLSKKRQVELSIAIANILVKKLQIQDECPQDVNPAGLIICIYLQIKDDWQI